MEKGNALDSNTWLDEHGDYLFRFAVLKLKDAALAEDLVQDTLLSAVAAKDTFSTKASIRTWLTTIMKNKMVDYWRRQGREVPVAGLMEEYEEGVSVDDFFDKAGRWADVPNVYPNPDSALESKQFWSIFEHCLSNLKPQQAEVFLAKEVHGMDSVEISESYSLSSSNVWVLMHRARVALGKCLEIHWVR
jgi:RNA polymerase sigma-70 factor, ECF subfamily